MDACVQSRPAVPVSSVGKLRVLPSWCRRPEEKAEQAAAAPVSTEQAAAGRAAAEQPAAGRAGEADKDVPFPGKMLEQYLPIHA